MKRLLIALLLVSLLAPAAQAQRMGDLFTASPLAAQLPAQALSAAWQGETLSLTLQRAISDHNALALTWQVAPNTLDPCYFALEKAYVNGIPVTMTRHVDAGPNWLAPRASAAMFDLSAIPQAESYTVTLSFLSLKPAGQVVYLPETDDSTDYLAYQQKIIDLNNQGCVVSTPGGRIQLSQDTYDPAMDYVYQLMAADKVTPWENPSVTFTLVPGAQPQVLTAWQDYENYGVSLRAELSPLSAAVTVTQTLSNTLTPEEAQSLTRRWAILDGSGQKNWYTGGTQDMGDLRRLADGAYQSIMTWHTQSLTALPRQLQAVPYTYDAYMSPVYETAGALLAEVP